MEEPLFDEETGVPLNDAARALVERADADTSAGAGGANAAAATGILASVPVVDIAEGKWKYVQIELSAPDSAQSLRVVRSYRGLKFHAQNYEKCMAGLEPVSSHSIPCAGRHILVDRNMAMRVEGDTRR